ncbi:T9SS type A sorting domain-containing protein [Flavobacterium aciduliphilum]|uniref:Putative secreted protein (Por secretion system target) n=1 Tax=Flavobacterium aciduliphilum TaxID=1101402 RepID=A0A328YH30_9FLAO|nr:T9SS type A sorting domain-containing protein [Flavobacterium aciduliphilum]RAR71292.1 putative secreted protein (Por secretion system target) [Flavobacterium aciduliphilum]
MKKTLLFILCAISSLTKGQNIFREDFTTYVSGQQLNGQGPWTNNSSSPGGLGSCVGVLCENAQVVLQNMSASGYGTSNKAFCLTPSTDGCGRSFTPFSSNGNLYVGMVINLSDAQSSPLDFFRVLSGNNYNTTFRMFVKPTSGSTYSIGISKGGTTSPIVYTTNSYNYNTDYLLIFKYTQASGTTDDTITLYANANYSLGEAGNTVSATNFAGTDQSGSIDRMCFRQNAGPAGMPIGKVSLVSVATSWEDLTFNLSVSSFSKNSVAIYPNPATSSVSIMSKKAITGVSVCTLLGQEVFVKSLDGSFSQLDISNLESGTYFIKIASESSLETFQLIKE